MYALNRTKHPHRWSRAIGRCVGFKSSAPPTICKDRAEPPAVVHLPSWRLPQLAATNLPRPFKRSGSAYPGQVGTNPRTSSRHGPHGIKPRGHLSGRDLPGTYTCCTPRYVGPPIRPKPNATEELVRTGGRRRPPLSPARFDRPLDRRRRVAAPQALFPWLGLFLGKK